MRSVCETFDAMTAEMLAIKYVDQLLLIFVIYIECAIFLSLHMQIIPRHRSMLPSGYLYVITHSRKLNVFSTSLIIWSKQKKNHHLVT